MELKLGVEILDSYKRLSYKVWYALAEYIDNSTQSYLNNKRILDEAYKVEGTSLNIKISYKNGAEGFIQIEDNSIGMNKQDLEVALTVGKRSPTIYGRSKYGLGLKTASFWFGDKWEIITKKINEDLEYHITADLHRILTAAGDKQNGSQENINNEAGNENNGPNASVISVTTKSTTKSSHYTKIIITKLNRQIASSTAKKTMDFLRSIYRYDIQNGTIIEFQGNRLEWNRTYFLDRLLKDEKNTPYLVNFDFEVNNKRVRGWAGVLEQGSRIDAGFSILQANRVIQGWPLAYRPTKLFGEQEGGTNNLVNQRLTGELFLDGFDVSHTKDEILFTEDEEEILNVKLLDTLAHLKKVAEEYRKPTGDQEKLLDSIDYKNVVQKIFKEIQMPSFRAEVFETPVLPSEIIEFQNNEVIEKVLNSGIHDQYEVIINDIKVSVLINSEGSPYEPYLIIRSRAVKSEITVVINRVHKHWEQLKSPELIFYFIKQCIYDGLAEWKAYYMADSLLPETIKLIKDSYLKTDITLQ